MDFTLTNLLNKKVQIIGFDYDNDDIEELFQAYCNWSPDRDENILSINRPFGYFSGQTSGFSNENFHSLTIYEQRHQLYLISNKEQNFIIVDNVPTAYLNENQFTLVGNDANYVLNIETNEFKTFYTR